MNILYLGKYNQRFKIITDLLNLEKDRSVTELCFGDTKIAEWCKLKKIKWTGFDINKKFIKYAKSKGYNAQFYDLLKIKNLPKSDVVIIMGSLYQFNNNLEKIIDLVMESTPKFIISEPIKNLATMNNFIGFMAKRFTKAGNGNEIFRYNYNSLSNKLNDICKNKFFVSEVNKTEKDLIVIIHKS